jgi:hypothetical protein
MRTDGHTERDGQTDMTKITVHFRNFSKAPKTRKFLPHGKQATCPLYTYHGTAAFITRNA